MRHPNTLIAYHYIKNMGFYSSEYTLHDTDDPLNPIYKIVGYTNGEIPKYERLKNFHLTKESVIAEQIKFSNERILSIEAELKAEKEVLLNFENYAAGKNVDFYVLEKK